MRVHPLRQTRLALNDTLFRKPAGVVSIGIAKAQKQILALIRLEIACQVALEALPELPDDTEQALRDHVQELCDVTGAET